MSGKRVILKGEVEHVMLQIGAETTTDIIGATIRYDDELYRVSQVETWFHQCEITLIPLLPKEKVEVVKEKSDYTVKAYVAHGYYQYTVPDMASAISHGHAIMSTGVYRRSTEAGDVEFHKVYKVKVCGEGLASEYPDEFKRT